MESADPRLIVTGWHGTIGVTAGVDEPLASRDQAADQITTAPDSTCPDILAGVFPIPRDLLPCPSINLGRVALSPALDVSTRRPRLVLVLLPGAPTVLRDNGAAPMRRTFRVSARPAEISFSIRGAAFQKFAQLLFRRDDMSGSMQIRVLLRIKVVCRLPGVLVHDPRVARILGFQPLADTARRTADDGGYRAVRAADSFTIETVQNQMQRQDLPLPFVFPRIRREYGSRTAFRRYWFHQRRGRTLRATKSQRVRFSIATNGNSTGATNSVERGPRSVLIGLRSRSSCGVQHGEREWKVLPNSFYINDLPCLSGGRTASAHPSGTGRLRKPITRARSSRRCLRT